MVNDSCCDDIIEVRAHVVHLESRMNAHEKSAEETFRNINNKLDGISKKLTTYVNPILALIITLMAGAIGWLAR